MALCMLQSTTKPVAQSTRHSPNDIVQMKPTFLPKRMKCNILLKGVAGNNEKNVLELGIKSDL